MLERTGGEREGRRWVTLHVCAGKGKERGGRRWEKEEEELDVETNGRKGEGKEMGKGRGGTKCKWEGKKNIREKE